MKLIERNNHENYLKCTSDEKAQNQEKFLNDPPKRIPDGYFLPEVIIKDKQEIKFKNYLIDIILAPYMNPYIQPPNYKGIEEIPKKFRSIPRDASTLLGRNYGIELLITELEKFPQGWTDQEFSVFLKDFVKQGFHIPGQEISQYELQYDIAIDFDHGHGKVFREREFDSPYNFCLTHEKELIASLGFTIKPQRIFVTQIQGPHKYGKSDQLIEKLKPFKWERALLKYAIKWAEEHSIAEIEVQSAQNNEWPRVSQSEQGKMLYDVTARRCGFKENITGNFELHLALRTSPSPLSYISDANHL